MNEIHRFYVFVQDNDVEKEKKQMHRNRMRAKRKSARKWRYEKAFNMQKLELRSNIKSNPFNGIRGSKELEHKAYVYAFRKYKLDVAKSQFNLR